MKMKELTAAQVDANLAVASELNENDLVFYDVRKPPFSIYGLYNSQNEPQFKRLPDDVAAAVSANVQVLYTNTAGGRVRFSTDSDVIAIKTVMSGVGRMPHFSLTGGASFDLYIDHANGQISQFYKIFIPPYEVENGYESEIKFNSIEQRYFTINFPTYSNVEALYVGVRSGAALGAGLTYKNELPVVYYGSSITQGGCASRPGNVYSAVISRRLDLDYINLGFSGSAKGESAMVDYIASLPMSVFVSDYDHNSSERNLAKTHWALYEKIRSAHPDIPYIMVSKADIENAPIENLRRRDTIIAHFHRAKEQGDTKVYFVDGATIYDGPYRDMCTVDTIHPNDLGHALMADAIGMVLKNALE